MKGKILVATFVWIVILGGLAMAYKWFFVPQQEAAKKEAEERILASTIEKTSAESAYKHQINFGIDSFSGYSILRSENLRNELAKKKIKLNLVDDNADYSARIKNIQSGNLQLAVFTVDSLVRASSLQGSLPATIVSIIDETRGADAVVAFKSIVPNVDALNRSDLKLILTPDSPSETLARVIMSHFNLSDLSANPFMNMPDAQAVYNHYRSSDPSAPYAYVLWEPYISKMLDNPNTHVVLDSSSFRGYIVDVIVVSRDFLLNNETITKDFVESYFRAVHSYRQEMQNLVLQDSRLIGAPLTVQQAERLVKGIWWKNTSENYAHMGLSSQSLQHIEDIISNITNVLVSTGDISNDPTAGRPNLLYYDGILKQLQDSNFHPGIENVRDESAQLPSLSEAEWGNLVPVGKLNVPELVFARGTDKLTDQSLRILDELIEKLKTWPTFYLTIQGNAVQVGNPDANRQLALARAKAAELYLVNRGINPSRVRAITRPATTGTKGASSVQFILGQPGF
jgi:ABC-type taurine transport system substrate-binding protein